MTPPMIVSMMTVAARTAKKSRKIVLSIGSLSLATPSSHLVQGYRIAALLPVVFSFECLCHLCELNPFDPCTQVFYHVQSRRLADNLQVDQLIKGRR